MHKPIPPSSAPAGRRILRRLPLLCLLLCLCLPAPGILGAGTAPRFRPSRDPNRHYLRVSVIGARGEPITGAEVLVVKGGGEAWGSNPSRDGVAWLYSPPRGWIIVRVSASGFVTQVQPLFYEGKPGDVELTVRLRAWPNPPGIPEATARGRVLDAEGRPVPGARVILSPGEDARVILSADAEGRYQVPHLPPGRYLLLAEKSGLEEQTDELIVARPGDVDGPLFRLKPRVDVPWSVRVVVQRKEDGTPLAGATVSLDREGLPEQFSLYRVAQTSQGGTVLLAELAPGRYRLRVGKPGREEYSWCYFSLWEGRSSLALPVTLARSAPMVPAGTLLVPLVGAAGAPLSGTRAVAQLVSPGSPGIGPWGDGLRIRHVQGSWNYDNLDIEVEAESDGRGLLRLRVPSGEYRLRVRAPGFLPAWMPVRVGLGSHEVSALHLARDERPLPPPASISGTVLLPDGKPAAHRVVYLFVSEHLSWVRCHLGADAARVETDGQGRFVRSVPRDGVELAVLKTAGYAETAPMRLALQPGGQADAEFRLKAPSCSFFGRVTAGGRPVPHARVFVLHGNGRSDWTYLGNAVRWCEPVCDARARRRDRRRPGEIPGLLERGLYYAEAGGDGRYRLDDVEEGPCRIGPVRAGYSGAFGGSYCSGGVRREAGNLDMDRLQSCRLALAGPDGAPLARVPVRIRHEWGRWSGGIVSDVTTSGSGRVEIGGFWHGVHTVRGKIAGFQPFVCEVRIPAPSTSATLRLSRGLSLRGRVVDAAGLPVPGAQVTAVQPDPLLENEESGQTGADGSFALAGLEPGEVFVRASAPGFAPVETRLEQDAEPVLRLGRGVALRGTVRDGGGNAVAGAYVSWWPSRPVGSPFTDSERDGTYTDAAGRFRLEGVLAGKVGVGVWRDVGYGSSKDVDLSPGVGQPEVLLAVPSDGMGAVRGRVLDEDGKPAAGVEVRVCVNGEDPAVPVFTDEGGEFHLAGLPADWAMVHLHGEVWPTVEQPWIWVRPGVETRLPVYRLMCRERWLRVLLENHEKAPDGTRVTTALLADDGDLVSAGASPRRVRLYAPFSTEPDGGSIGPSRIFDGLLSGTAGEVLSVAAADLPVRCLNDAWEQVSSRLRVGSGGGWGETPVAPWWALVAFRRDTSRVDSTPVPYDDIVQSIIFQPGVRVQPGPGTQSQEDTCRLTLRPWGTVAGRLLKADGAPMRGVRVWFIRRERWEPAGFVTTGDDGSFKAEGLVDGEYEADVWEAGWAGLRRPFSVARGETAELALRLEQGVSLCGRVDGSLQKYLHVCAENEAAFGAGDVRADGTFTIAHLPPGSYTLRIWQDAGPRIVTREGVAVGPAGAEGVTLRW